jgi:hypothetical protein
LAKQLQVDIAETRLAIANGVMGIASYDNGGYYETDDKTSYSIKDHEHVAGFIEMCLFDYLIMNEDRHAGNWGIINGKVAPLFDHNFAFGGETPIVDIDNWMPSVTTAFYVTDHHKQRHDTILEYLVLTHAAFVARFMEKLNASTPIHHALWNTHFPDDFTRLNKILAARIKYMNQKVGEYGAK